MDCLLAIVTNQIIIELKIIEAYKMIEVWEGVVALTINVVTTITATVTNPVFMTIIATAVTTVVVMKVVVVTINDSTTLMISTTRTVTGMITDFMIIQV